MKQDYWNVTDEQVIEKTGKKIAKRADQFNPTCKLHLLQTGF
jgi:hypothetical protein